MSTAPSDSPKLLTALRKEASSGAEFVRSYSCVISRGIFTVKVKPRGTDPRQVRTVTCEGVP